MDFSIGNFSSRVAFLLHDVNFAKLWIKSYFAYLQFFLVKLFAGVFTQRKKFF